MDAEIPPVAGEQSLRFKLRPAVRVLVLYSVVGLTSVANSPSMCTRDDHIGEPEQFIVLLGQITAKNFLCVRKTFISDNLNQIEIR